MPIHDQSYRRYKGLRESPRSAWTVIAVNGITGFLKKRAFLAFLLVAWIPFIARAVQIYVAANFAADPGAGDEGARPSASSSTSRASSSSS